MKQLIKNYSFNATSKTVTLSDFTTVVLERLQLIIDATTNTILYNFADSSIATATVATNVITLSTVGSATGTDKLMVVYDAAAGDPVYDLPLVGSEPSTSTFSVTTVSATSSIDGGNYRWVSVQVTGQGTSSVVNFQGSNDGTNWFSIGLSLAGNTSAAPVSSTNATGIYHGPLPARYFRLNVTGISAGTTSGVIVLSSLPTALQAIGGSVAQIGTWTVGANSATGSAVPANGFYDATRAATSLPSATSNGQLVGLMSDKFGRGVVIPQATRDIVGTQDTAITVNTATTVITAGGAGVFTDISSIVFTNNSATAVTVTLSDGTASYHYYVPAGDMRGATYQVPLPATTANTAWTVTSSSAITTLYVDVTYIKNQ